MEQPIERNKFSYFARSRLRLRPQEIWERDYVTCAARSVVEIRLHCILNSSLLYLGEKKIILALNSGKK